MLIIQVALSLKPNEEESAAATTDESDAISLVDVGAQVLAEDHRQLIDCTGDRENRHLCTLVIANKISYVCTSFVVINYYT